LHEDARDDETTHEMRPPTLLPPVDRPDDLPTDDVEQGTLCLVASGGGEDRLWAYRDGGWEPAAP